MSTLLIEGGHRLGGRVSVEGNKNAALPLPRRVPADRRRVRALKRAANRRRRGHGASAARLGVEVEGIGTTTLRIRAKQVKTHAPDRSLVGRLRGSVLLLGPLLARTGRARIAPPGGDFPARRSISTHLGALQAMGARIVSGDDHFLEAPEGLKNASMYLDEASVTGTETALLAAASAPGSTEIRHAATEPHVVELCEFLSKMGAVVSGIGSSRLRIEGMARVGGAQHRLGGDYIEAGAGR
jgi:UDP-N-acetylglucosamine 1-carboxyvinyltransferase